MKRIRKFKVTSTLKSGKTVSQPSFGRKDLNVVISALISDVDVESVNISKEGFADASDIKIWNL
jgi:hypothetical protein